MIGWVPGEAGKPNTMSASMSVPIKIKERAELINWAVFDCLPLVLEQQPLDLRYWHQVLDFGPAQDLVSDHRLRDFFVLLQKLPYGTPVSLTDQERSAITQLVNEGTWFHPGMVTLLRGGGGIYVPSSACFAHARYLFWTHLANGYHNQGAEWAETVVHDAYVLGAKRPEVYGLAFNGRRYATGLVQETNVNPG